MKKLEDFKMKFVIDYIINKRRIIKYMTKKTQSNLIIVKCKRCNKKSKDLYPKINKELKSVELKEIKFPHFHSGDFRTIEDYGYELKLVKKE